MVKIKEIEVESTCLKVLDVDGTWVRQIGVPITINGFKFFFVPTGNPMNQKIDAYSLDSLKVFESFKIPHKVALHQCAAEEGFIRTIIPFAIKIGENLSELEDSKWKSILKGERAAAIAECGARNEKEAKLLDDFEKRKQQ
ncbi:hypothetical protein [Lactobacillus crispatus]|jgi:hypothetical protein|uniref:hypothetical protein n=1 Tax=Lactobacillus crispatus TaxID=47770 RepID=UPI001F095060|nr:hypothetical protein [Lactobacillus crispatus]MCZ9661886.1 hypothetical protein [Lactobacillus crispatus]DAX36426.1 MAG TPA: hypothetical protein [Caudoviricetes sp.]